MNIFSRAINLVWLITLAIFSLASSIPVSRFSATPVLSAYNGQIRVSIVHDREFTAGEAAGLNLYEYANNDPINQVDPSGLCPVRGTVLGEGQYRDANGDLRDANGDLLKDPLDPLNPVNPVGPFNLLNPVNHEGASHEPQTH